MEGSDVREPGCPKRMVHGPCGGVRADGSCELGDRPCPFVGRPLRTWAGPRATPTAPHPDGLLGVAARRPVVVVDFGGAPFDAEATRAAARRFAGVADALLLGEHQSRSDLPPTLRASIVADAGCRPWVTLTCRDRNRVVLEEELAGLRAVGVEGVHCVTGDARAPGVRPEVTQVFDVDSLELVALARAAGLVPSVAETPLAPPTVLRPARLVEKQRAGATACFVNHAGGAAPVGALVAAAGALGSSLAFVPCVPVFTDARSAEVLATFPGIRIDPAQVAAVLGADDPRRAGIDAAVRAAREMLEVPGVVGVDLSGSASSAGPDDAAEVMLAVAGEVRGG